MDQHVIDQQCHYRDKKDHILVLKNALKINFFVFSPAVRSLLAPTVYIAKGKLWSPDIQNLAMKLAHWHDLHEEPSAISLSRWQR